MTSLRPPVPLLTDGVVTLRLPTEADVPAIERGIWDPDVVRSLGRPQTDGAAILEVNRSRWREGIGATFAVCEALDACVGHVWVNLGGAGRGAVGYWLLPEARGRGVATRSVRLVCVWAFGPLGLVGLDLFVEPENLDSVGVAERAGFRRTGLLRSHGEIDGRRVDHVVFSMVPADLGNMDGP